MNRKDRRAQASQERRGDTMGRGYTVLPELPESVRNHPKYKEGVARRERGEGFPPEYFQAIDVGASYLADSPDASALLEWLDGATGRNLSLNMAGWALRKLGMMPMPDGSTWKGEPS